MLQDQSSEQEVDDPDSEFVEVDPTGRYGRYKEVLGRGAFKKVYRGFDKLEGIEIAWNQVKVADLLRNSVDLERLYSEVHLLKTLKHKNIIKFYNSWVETKNENINFITEIFTSGTLRQYRKKHKHVDVRALKKWSKQILEGLFYLHSHDPPVIHRDLKCDNIFVNGNQGEIKIGDLGLAAILQRHSAHSVIGTPEFMAPELYEEEYNELVDIYAFGMCLLELVTFDYPYVECSNAAQIYKKVTSGIRPASLAKVKDSRVKAFIEKCIVKVSERSSAKALLMDPFLQEENDHGSIGRSIPSYHNLEGINHRNSAGKIHEDDPAMVGRDFKVQGQRKDMNTIFLKLRIADSSGHCRNIHFPFDIEEDTAIAVASEMVEELDLTDQDVTAIAAMIDSEIQTLIPGWSSNEINGDEFGEETPTHGNYVSETIDVASPFGNESDSSTSSFRLEKLPSGRMYWSDSPKFVVGSSPSSRSESNMSSQVDMIYKCGSITRNPPPSTGKGLDQCIRDDDDVQKNATYFTKAHSRDDNSNRDTKARNIGQISKENLRGGTESDYMNTIVKKLEELLIRQETEVKELRRKHESAVSDLLKEFYPETRKRILNMCNLKLSLGNEQ